MTEERLTQISRSWALHIDDIHDMVSFIRRPAFERAVDAIMQADNKELDLLKRLCESLLFDPNVFREIKSDENL